MNQKISKALLETKSVYLNIQDPFIFPSGRISPVYVDCRRLISYPQMRDEVVAELVRIVKEEIGLDETDVVAGGTTGGIPFATFFGPGDQKASYLCTEEPCRIREDKANNGSYRERAKGHSPGGCHR